MTNRRTALQAMGGALVLPMLSGAYTLPAAMTNQNVQAQVDALPWYGGEVHLEGECRFYGPVHVGDKRVGINGENAIIIPEPGVTCFIAHQGRESAGVFFERLNVQPDKPQEGQTGVLLETADSATIRDCRFANLSAGIHAIARDDTWIETTHVENTLFSRCTRAMLLQNVSAQRRSFGEWHLSNVRINTSGGNVGIEVDGGPGEGVRCYRTHWLNLTVWMGAGQNTGVSVRNTDFDGGFMTTAFEASQGDNTGWYVGDGNRRLDKAAIYMQFDGGGMAREVANPHGTLFRYYKSGGRDVVLHGDTRALRVLLADEAHARLEFHGRYANGGGFRLGSGMEAPDVDVRRVGPGLVDMS